MSPLPTPPVLRVPLYGAIGPRMTVAVYLEPPLHNEQLVVLTTDPPSIHHRVMSETIVVIQNKSDKAIAFTILFLPANQRLPPPEAWNDLWMQIK